MKNLKVNVLDYIELISLALIILNGDKYRITSPIKWVNDLGFNVIYILGTLFVLKLAVMVVEDGSNIYLKRGK